MTLLPLILALLATGFAAGVLAGLFGVGGGIVIVPVLFFIFQLLDISPATAMSVAVGTSMLIIIATSVSSLRAHHKLGHLDVNLVRDWAPLLALGAIAGAVAAAYAGGVFVSLIFGLFSLLLALNMLLGLLGRARWPTLPSAPVQAFYAVIIGMISAVVGVGGGALSVPLLSSYSYPMHRAIGTSAGFGFVIAVPGALAHLLASPTPADAPVMTFGAVNIIGFLIIMPVSVAVAPLGARIGAHMNEKRLRRWFAFFLLLSGLRMLYKALQAL